MKIREIMTTNVEVAEPDDTLDEIATMMRDQDVGSIPVVEGDALIGIITDRDIVVRCVAEGKNPSEIAADEIISGDLRTVEPDDDVEEALRIMSEMQIRRLPVLTGGRLVGMLSIGDLAVKTNDEELVADTLENVSDGVKASDQSWAEDRSKVRKGTKGQRMEGRQETLERSGKQQQSLHSRIEESQGAVDRTRQSGGRLQGITSHAADEEVKREGLVVPIRSKQKSNVRGNKQSGRKAG